MKRSHRSTLPFYLCFLDSKLLSCSDLVWSCCCESRAGSLPHPFDSLSGCPPSLSCGDRMRVPRLTWMPHQRFSWLKHLLRNVPAPPPCQSSLTWQSMDWRVPPHRVCCQLWRKEFQGRLSPARRSPSTWRVVRMSRVLTRRKRARSSPHPGRKSRIVIRTFLSRLYPIVKGRLVFLHLVEWHAFWQSRLQWWAAKTYWSSCCCSCRVGQSCLRQALRLALPWGRHQFANCFVWPCRVWCV